MLYRTVNLLKSVRPRNANKLFLIYNKSNTLNDSEIMYGVCQMNIHTMLYQGVLRQNKMIPSNEHRPYNASFAW